jgi:hypothetical protein
MCSCLALQFQFPNPKFSNSAFAPLITTSPSPKKQPYSPNAPSFFFQFLGFLAPPSFQFWARGVNVLFFSSTATFVNVLLLFTGTASFVNVLLLIGTATFLNVLLFSRSVSFSKSKIKKKPLLHP